MSPHRHLCSLSLSLSLSPEMLQNQVETLAEDDRTPVEEELKEIDSIIPDIESKVGKNSLH